MSVRERVHPMSEKMRGKIIAAHEAYLKLGTLQRAALRLSLSRERVRQLLKEGVVVGLIPPLPPKDRSLPPNPFTSRTAAVKALRQYGTLLAVSRATGYPVTRLHQHVQEFGLSMAERAAIYRGYRKHVVCYRGYVEMLGRLGHHPTSTELQRSPRGRSIESYIRRHWGSILTFRRAYGIRLDHQRTPRRDLLKPAV